MSHEHSPPLPVAPEPAEPPGIIDEPKLPPQKPPVAPRRFGWPALIAVAAISSVLSASAALVALRITSSNAGSQQETKANDVLYQCPMHPTIVQDHPGDCPICGMKLVKVERSKLREPSNPSATMEAAAPTASASVAGMAPVEIDPARQQLIGLKTSEVVLGTVGGAWRTVGRVAVDETRVRHVNLKIAGFVEKVYVDYIGKRVQRGAPLFSIYSPELLAAQEEYLLALKTRGELAKVSAAPADDTLVSAARRKLELWDISAAALDKLEKTRQPSRTLTFYSPATGVVTKKDVVEGMKLDAGAMPYEIVDLSNVWVLADVYESELRFVKEGMAANLTLAAFPGREFKGKVVFLDPLLDPQTRTVKVRLTFPNPNGELRPEMFGEVVLLGPPHEALRVPLDAVVDSGTEKLAFVASGEGKFEPRSIEVGANDGSYIEVVRGLRAGERVVTRANFLVDSESRLRASLAEATPTMKASESARVLPSASPPVESKPTTPPAPQSGSHAGHGR
ncbi:MAG: efflux RND transporter periplasmic adaptor subunit [Myxococcota bacterium]